MPVLPQNEVLELILKLITNKRMPMVPSTELNQMLGPYSRDQLGMTAGQPIDTTNVADPMGVIASYNRGREAPSTPPPISRDPWFDQLEQGGNPEGWPPGTESFAEDTSPGSPAWNQQHQTLVADMMRALGIESNGSHARYMSQLQDVNDAFIMRIAEKLGLNADGEPNIARVLIANEFEHFGPKLPR